MPNSRQIRLFIFYRNRPLGCPKRLWIPSLILALYFISSCHWQLTSPPVFQPSLGSRFARLTVKYYLAPAFSSTSTIADTREALSNLSRLTWLPSGTRVKELKIGKMDAELITAPEASTADKAIVVYLHGGGFFSGSPATHRELAARISKASGFPVLVPDYRLAPENKYPAANEDCLTVYRWLLRNGYSSVNIAIGGDSAGGCLTIMTLLSLRDAGDPLPAAAFMLSPLTDAVHLDGKSLRARADQDPWFKPETLDKHLRHYIGGLKPSPAILSPVRQDLSGLPPMLIQVGEDEILYSDSKRLAKRAVQAGVDVSLEVWDDMWHVFQAFGTIMPESRHAIDHIGVFLRKHLH